MATWFKPNCKTSCCKAPPLVESDLVTTHFTYDATTTTPTDTIPFSLLQGISQIVIGGTIPYPNTVIYMPPHTALLDLFTNPIADDQFSFDVSNTGANSIDLLIYKTNAEATGSGLDAYAPPLRYITIPATSVVRLALRVINASPVAGEADVKMLAAMEGGTGSITYPPMTFNLGAAGVGAQALIAQPSANALNLFGQNIVPNLLGPEYQIVVTGGLAGQTITPYVPVAADGVAQLLYPFTRQLTTSLLLEANPLMVSPIAAGNMIVFSIVVSNQTAAQTLAWSGVPAITGLSYTGTAPVSQPALSTYRATFRFTIAGVSTTAPKWQASTLSIELQRIADPNPQLATVFWSYRPLTAPVLPTYVASNIGYIGGTSQTTTFAANVPLTTPGILATVTIAQGVYLVGYTLIITNANQNCQMALQFGTNQVVGAAGLQSGPINIMSNPIAIGTTTTWTGTAVLTIVTAIGGTFNLYGASTVAALTTPSGSFWALRIA